MPSLEAVLLELYEKGDPRISLLSWFQRAPYTYVKVVINDGEHDIFVQEIRGYPHCFCGHEDEALNNTIRSALQKAAGILTQRALASMIKGFSSDPV